VVRAWGVLMKKGSMLFFEKKNQKTFIHLRAPSGESFFASFFSKKEDS
jgi:hypothetical protein